MAVNRFTEKGLFKLLSPSVSVANLATSYFRAGSEILKEVISGSTVFSRDRAVKRYWASLDIKLEHT